MGKSHSAIEARRTGIRGGILLLASLFCLALAQVPTIADVPAQCLPIQQCLRIHMVDGRALDAVSYHVDAGVAFVEVTEGASLGLPLSRIASIETLQIPQPPLESHEAPDALEAPVVTTDPHMQPVVLPQPATGIVPAAGPAPETASDQGPLSIDSLIRRAAKRHHLEPELLAAVIAAESGYRPSAQSAKGAQGLMQLMPSTARDLSVTDPFDAAQNIEAGARYLRQLLDQHGDSFVSALAAYNAGMGRVARYKGVPPYRETIQYIGRVLKNYASATQASPDPSPASK